MRPATPTPWTVSTSPDYFTGGATVVRATSPSHCGIVVCVVTKTKDEHKNALLLSLAPELLEALRAVEKTSSYLLSMGGGDATVDALNKMHAVLNKLRG